MSKSVKPKINPNTKIIKDTLTSVFDNNYLAFGLLFIIWIIFFRELIIGNAFLFDDFIEQYFPGKTFSAVSLNSGEFPLWNPYTFGGMPFFADLQIAILYPFNYILRFFVNGDKLSPVIIQFTIVLHYLFASIFCFFLGKQFKFSNITSILFGIFYTYSSYMIVHMIHMPLVEAAAWFPLIFLLWLKFLDSGKYIFVMSAAFIMLLCILCGYPQVPFFNYMFIAFYVLIIFITKIKEKDKEGIISISIGFLIFLIIPFALSAVQLLPTSEFVNYSNRASFDYNFAKQGSLHIYDFATLFLPKVFGVWTGNESSTDMPWWTSHQEGMFAFSYANVYISALIVVIIVPSVRYLLNTKFNYSFVKYLLILTFFTFLFALGGNFFFHKLLYDFVPLFNRFRNPSHILYIASFSIIILSLFGIDAVLKDKKAFAKYFDKKYLIIIISTFTIFLILSQAGFFKPASYKNAEQINSWIQKQYFAFFLFATVFSFLIYLYINDKLNFKVFTSILLLLVFVDVYYYWFDQNNGTRNPEKVFSQNSQLENKLKDELKTEHFRVNMRIGGSMIFKRNQGMTGRVELIEGYNALILQKYYPFNKIDSNSTQNPDLLNLKYRLNPKTNQLVLNPSYMKRASMFYNIKVISNDDEIKKYMESPEFDYRKTLVIEKNPSNVNLPVIKDSLSIPKSDVKITDYTLNKITLDVETSENGFLFLSEVYYPAFKAYVDGKETEIYRTDYSMRSVYIEKGKHIVEMKYESDTIKTGINISIISLILFFGVYIFLLYRFYDEKKKRLIKNDNITKE